MSDLYQLPNEWKWINLDKYSNVTSSKRVHKKDYIESGIPFYRSKEIILKSKSIEPTDILYISEDTFNEFKLKFGTPQKGDILITAVGTLGVTYLVSETDNFYFKDGNLLWIKDIKENVYVEYLLYYFKSPMFFNDIDKISKGAAQKALTITKLTKLNIPLPPLLEQQRIASKVDNLFEKIDKAISLHQKNIDAANIFMGSILNDVFEELKENYGKTAISDVMKISNKTLVPNDNEEYNYVGLENIESNNGKLVGFSSTNGIEIKSSKVEFKKGMVLYGKLRPYLNKVWISDFDGVATTEILPFYPINKSELDMHFVKYYFLSPSYLAKVMSNCSGARMPRLTTKFIKSEEAYIPLPSLYIQQKVVKYLDEVSKKIEGLKLIQKEKMNNLKDLKASILDKAFKGEL